MNIRDLRQGFIGLLAALVVAVGASAAMPLAAATRSLAPDVRSQAALIVRTDTGEVLYSKNADRTLPIASITKLMTAMVVIDAGQSLDERLQITSAEVDRLRGSSSRLAVGTRLTRRQALLLALMSSENRAAAALLRTYPGGRTAGVAAMNRKARALGMTRSGFVEGTGLSGENRSTPADLVRLVQAASRYPLIRDFSTREQFSIMVGRHPTLYRNTNPLVRNPGWDIDLTKTGYLSEAGRCLVMKTRITNTPVVMILMNSWGNLTRVGDANRVRRWLEAGHLGQATARR
jgi:serine-type D-Ala-D-Ala endopeptidase (penicillin-binding protein 7)